jgi:mannose-6-phosphate isomerase-like protein (cupin superfamily)
MLVGHPVVVVAALVTTALAASITRLEADDRIAVANLDTIVKANPLTPDGRTAAMVAWISAGGASLSVLVMSKNRLHHHVAQDHVLYLARGNGIARLENAAGQVETRTIAPGDILSLPRGRKHGFEKAGEEDLVFLVVATPLPPGVEETTYHE